MFLSRNESILLESEVYLDIEFYKGNRDGSLEERNKRIVLDGKSPDSTFPRLIHRFGKYVNLNSLLSTHTARHSDFLSRLSL